MKFLFQKRSDASAIYFDPKDNRTKQEFVAQSNINNIINKYAKNGINPFVLTKDSKFGDFTKVPSHQEALELVIRAEDHFMQLPAELRSRFNNDPGELLDFLGDKANRKEAISLGLVQDLNKEKDLKIQPAAEKLPEETKS